jgi:hypothetical protein
MNINEKVHEHVFVRFDHKIGDGTPLYRCESPLEKVKSCGELLVPFVYGGDLDLSKYVDYKIKPYKILDPQENRSPLRTPI